MINGDFVFNPPYTPEELQPLVKTTPKERERIKQFQNNHNSCGNGSTHYEVYPTSIAPVIYIICDNCKEKKDITDYESW